MESNNNF
jgi:hypothetical protein